MLPHLIFNSIPINYPRPKISREELDELVQKEHAEDGIVIAKVDATKESALATRFKIRSYPTLKYFADRKVCCPQ